MYSSDSVKQSIVASSSTSGPSIRIQIGTEAEKEKTLSPQSVPLFIRNAVYNVAVEKKLISSSTTAESMNVADVIRNSATIKTYIDGVESAYSKPSICKLFVFLLNI